MAQHQPIEHIRTTKFNQDSVRPSFVIEDDPSVIFEARWALADAIISPHLHGETEKSEDDLDTAMRFHASEFSEKQLELPEDKQMPTAKLIGAVFDEVQRLALLLGDEFHAGTIDVPDPVRIPDVVLGRLIEARNIEPPIEEPTREAARLSMLDLVSVVKVS